MSTIFPTVLAAFLQSARKPLIVILGPTASGKTALSIDVARWIASQSAGERSAEIVNADSRQIYAHLDIGTAKITADEMGGVPHHLLSVLDAKASLSIGWYQREATATIDAVLARGNIPLLVGGSMLYISAIIDGLQPIGSSDASLRSRFEREYEEDGGVALHQRLETIDPASAATIPKENKIYLLRALEIAELTGVPKSSQLHQQKCPYDLLIFGIRKPRDELVNRINRRTHHLLHNGWVEEVRGLIERGYLASDPGMQSHGYREIIDHLRSGGSLEKLEPIIASKTRQYAKRQMTWWRGDERIVWLCD